MVGTRLLISLPVVPAKSLRIRFENEKTTATNGSLVLNRYGHLIYVTTPSAISVLLKKEQAVAQGQSAASCAPIVRALITLPNDERAKLRKNFGIAYFVAMESIPLWKYSRLCELE